ncbi:hypothetical protein QD460_09615 [Rhizobium jaguaris]|uniref:hypothetical protein n=1 Tax=Rhizobium jaguaris TaxID=1312183 RepID=UPI0039BF6F8A
MGRHLFTATTLVLAAAAALSSVSASADDFRRGHRPFLPSGPVPFHHSRLVAFNHSRLVPFHHSRFVRLQEISWPQRYRQPQPARIILMDPQYAASAGTYAGTTSVYQADGGTYVLGYGGNGGYGGYQSQPATPLKPRAKVINVKLARNACSYEAGVCVIRP